MAPADARLIRLSKDFAQEVEQVVIGLRLQGIVNLKLLRVTASPPQMKPHLPVSTRHAPVCCKPVTTIFTRIGKTGGGWQGRCVLPAN